MCAPRGATGASQSRLSSRLKFVLPPPIPDLQPAAVTRCRSHFRGSPLNRRATSFRSRAGAGCQSSWGGFCRLPGHPRRETARASIRGVRVLRALRVADRRPRRAFRRDVGECADVSRSLRKDALLRPDSSDDAGAPSLAPVVPRPDAPRARGAGRLAAPWRDRPDVRLQCARVAEGVSRACTSAPSRPPSRGRPGRTRTDGGGIRPGQRGASSAGPAGLSSGLSPPAVVSPSVITCH